MDLKEFIKELNQTIAAIVHIKSSKISKVSKSSVISESIDNYFQLKIETEMFIPTFEQIKTYTNGYLKLNHMVKDSGVYFQVDNNEDKPCFYIMSTDKNMLEEIQNNLNITKENKE